MGRHPGHPGRHRAVSISLHQVTFLDFEASKCKVWHYLRWEHGEEENVDRFVQDVHAYIVFIHLLSEKVFITIQIWVMFLTLVFDKCRWHLYCIEIAFFQGKDTFSCLSCIQLWSGNWFLRSTSMVIALFSTGGALRIPKTYDNHSIQPNPIHPHFHKAYWII